MSTPRVILHDVIYMFRCETSITYGYISFFNSKVNQDPVRNRKRRALLSQNFDFSENSTFPNSKFDRLDSEAKLSFIVASNSTKSAFLSEDNLQV